jgi:hypothetical protein
VIAANARLLPGFPRRSVDKSASSAENRAPKRRNLRLPPARIGCIVESSMTFWLEIPQMLGSKTDAELTEMRKIACAHGKRFARIMGPAALKECEDALHMIDKIDTELEIRRKARALMQ